MAKKTRLTNVIVNEVSLVDKGANKKRYYLMKRDEMADKEVPAEKTEAKVEVDTVALEKAASDAKAEVEALKTKLADIEKADAEGKAKVIELEKAAQDAVAAKVEIEKKLADAEEAKAVQEEIQKAAVSYKNLAAKSEDLGADLRKVRKSDTALAERFEAVLKKANDLVAQTLEPKGAVVAADANLSAWEEIVKRADEMVAAKAAPNQAVAIDKVLLSDQKLYAAYEAEKKGK